MFIFGDSFDCYATVADAGAGYWDSGVFTAWTLAAGRFAGSQALSVAGITGVMRKGSGANDAVHHFCLAFRQTAAISGASLGLTINLIDTATVQCVVVFRSDGAMLLASGSATGTVLATYTGAVPAANTWYAFEIEVVINNATGRFRVRKNGNTVDDFDSGAVLNTRGGTANNYANFLAIGQQTLVTAQQIDDLLWRSDASSVPFVGDIRCYTRMPASDASVQFARSPSSVTVPQSATNSTTLVKAANAGMMSAFTPTYSGTIASGTVMVSVGGTGNMKAAIYDSARTTVLATSNTVVNPVSGANTITFGTPLTVTRGTTYHLATDQDFSMTYNITTNSQWSFTTTYASFPAANPSLTSAQSGPQCFLNITPTISAEYVNEAQQDGTTSYVYDSTAGDADLYNIGTIASTPVATIAVTTRGFMEKSDAGLRTAAVQIKSGGTTVASPTATLSSSWGWVWRTDLTDPATSAAWTAVGVNGVNIGPKTVA